MGRTRPKWTLRITRHGGEISFVSVFDSKGRRVATFFGPRAGGSDPLPSSTEALKRARSLVVACKGQPVEVSVSAPGQHPDEWPGRHTYAYDALGAFGDKGVFSTGDVAKFLETPNPGVAGNVLKELCRRGYAEKLGPGRWRIVDPDDP